MAVQELFHHSDVQAGAAPGLNIGIKANTN
jgi:hypothetical protein